MRKLAIVRRQRFARHVHKFSSRDVSIAIRELAANQINGLGDTSCEAWILLQNSTRNYRADIEVIQFFQPGRTLGLY